MSATLAGDTLTRASISKDVAEDNGAEKVCVMRKIAANVHESNAASVATRASSRCFRTCRGRPPNAPAAPLTAISQSATGQLKPEATVPESGVALVRPSSS